MDDIEEDPKLREKINIYRKKHTQQISISTMEEDDEIENGPTLEEMLEDLDIGDVEMRDAHWMFLWLFNC